MEIITNDGKVKIHETSTELAECAEMRFSDWAVSARFFRSHQEGQHQHVQVSMDQPPVGCSVNIFDTGRLWLTFESDNGTRLGVMVDMPVEQLLDAIGREQRFHLARAGSQTISQDG